MTRKEIRDWATKTVHEIFHKKPEPVEFLFAAGTDVNTTLFGPLLRRLWKFVKSNDNEITIHIKRY